MSGAGISPANDAVVVYKGAGNDSKLQVVLREGMSFAGGTYLGTTQATIDANGNLWVALCHGGCVTCFDPNTGEQLRKVDLPCVETTACAFGGPNLDELYITRARKNLSDADLEKQPLAGGLFKVKVAVRGVESAAFAG